MEVFKDYAYYYNTFYRDKDYGTEARQIDGCLQRYGKNINTLINLGCGTGKHDLEFAEMGYQCTGIDMSSLMIAIAEKNAKEANVSIDFQTADIRSYIPQKQFDAVISLFHVMSYQNSNHDIIAAFRTARKALLHAGLFLFDVWYGPGVLNDKPAVRIKEIEDEENRLIRVARPVMHENENVVDVNYDVFVIDKASGTTKEIRETHNMRYFFRPEIELLLAEADFELIDCLDCRTLEKTDFSSWTSFFIARAI